MEGFDDGTDATSYDAVCEEESANFAGISIIEGDTEEGEEGATSPEGEEEGFPHGDGARGDATGGDQHRPVEENDFAVEKNNGGDEGHDHGNDGDRQLIQADEEKNGGHDDLIANEATARHGEQAAQSRDVLGEVAAGSFLVEPVEETEEEVNDGIVREFSLETVDPDRVGALGFAQYSIRPTSADRGIGSRPTSAIGSRPTSAARSRPTSAARAHSNSARPTSASSIHRATSASSHRCGGSGWSSPGNSSPKHSSKMGTGVGTVYFAGKGATVREFVEGEEGEEEYYSSPGDEEDDMIIWDGSSQVSTSPIGSLSPVQNHAATPPGSQRHPVEPYYGHMAHATGRPLSRGARPNTSHQARDVMYSGQNTSPQAQFERGQGILGAEPPLESTVRTPGGMAAARPGTSALPGGPGSTHAGRVGSHTPVQGGVMQDKMQRGVGTRISPARTGDRARPRQAVSREEKDGNDGKDGKEPSPKRHSRSLTMSFDHSNRPGTSPGGHDIGGRSLNECRYNGEGVRGGRFSSGRQRAAMAASGSGVPGPGTYMPEVKGKRAKGGAFGRKGNDPGSLQWQIERSRGNPPPGAYTGDLSRQISLSGGPVLHSGASRDTTPLHVTPGPGEYDPQNCRKQSGRRVSGGMMSDAKPLDAVSQICHNKRNIPGPGMYSLPDPLRPSSGKRNRLRGTRLGTGVRPPLTPHRDGPGPGTYHPKHTKDMSQVISLPAPLPKRMGRPRPGVGPPAEFPGPGQYSAVGHTISSRVSLRQWPGAGGGEEGHGGRPGGKDRPVGRRIDPVIYYGKQGSWVSVNEDARAIMDLEDQLMASSRMFGELLNRLLVSRGDAREASEGKGDA